MKRLLSAIFAVSLLAGTVAVAHADDHRDRDSRHWNDRDRDHRSEHHHSDRDRHDWDRNRHHDWNRHDHDWNRDHDWYRHDAWRGARYHYRVEPYRWPSGYRHYAWSRGDYLPGIYRAPRYVIYDYGRYGLYAPPRGCHWVRVGNDVLLTAVTTGVVVNIVSDLFY